MILADTAPPSSHAWSRLVQNKSLLAAPIHRWHTFPHSFASALVHRLIDEWNLSETDVIVDPFVGAGTTVLAAKERNVPAIGYDLSPFAAFVSKAKVAPYADPSGLRAAAKSLLAALSREVEGTATVNYPPIVLRALPGLILKTLDSCKSAIEQLPSSSIERDFMMLALLTTIRRFSRALPAGGWLKWTRNSSRSTSFRRTLSDQIELMIRDVETVGLPPRADWSAHVADARRLPAPADAYTALITSPPYPNRHDYTRVFCVELLFGFLTETELRSLRHQTIQSHPESRPRRPKADGYNPPELLSETIFKLANRGADRRIERMLYGYFIDMHLFLSEARRVCRCDARIAVVVGNVQYVGVPVLVDEIIVSIGEAIGLECVEFTVARHRGNSAQQMGKFGRHPARETVLVFRC